MKIPTQLWLLAAITTISATISAGYAFAALGVPHDNNALYAVSRSLALLLVVLAVVVLRSRSALIALAAAMILVQLFDSYPGALAHNTVKTFGPLATAAFNFAALVLFVRTPRSLQP